MTVFKNFRGILRLFALAGLGFALGCDRPGSPTGKGAVAPDGVPPVKAQTATGALDKDAINTAANRFLVDFSRPPKDLAELVREKYLAALPGLPLGQRLVFDPQTKKFQLTGP